MSPQREFSTSGALPYKGEWPELTDDEWSNVQEVLTDFGKKSPADFRIDLNLALATWFQLSPSIKLTLPADASERERLFENYSETGPKVVRKRLETALEVALKLNEKLNDLGGTSRQLLGEVPEANILQLYDNLGVIITALNAGLQKARGFPTTRIGLADPGPPNMGNILYWAIKRHLGMQPTSTDEGLFARLYAILAKKVRCSSDRRAVLAALRFAKDYEAKMPEGPITKPA